MAKTKATKKAVKTTAELTVAGLAGAQVVKAHQMTRGGKSYVTLTLKNGRSKFVLSVKGPEDMVAEVRKG